MEAAPRVTFRNDANNNNRLMNIIQVLLKPKEERKERDFTMIAKILKDISFFKQREM
jgi:hypothetical protein